MIMNDKTLERKLNILGKRVREAAGSLAFTILEIGALPLDGQTEPFYQLMDLFPESQIIAFEVDKNTCEQLNRNAKPGVTYYPVALGRTEEGCPFYETIHPMCGSLYKPNEKLMVLYHNLEVAELKSVTTIETLSLDWFIKEHEIRSVDFIKIDIQGAELELYLLSIWRKYLNFPQASCLKWAFWLLSTAARM
jgi:FkbM family methyltransferase